MRKRKYPDLPDRSHPDYARLYREKNKERLSEASKERYKKRRKDSPELFKYDPVAAAEYRANNPKRYREHNWRRHGIKDFTYEKYLSELAVQSNKCKICGAEMTMPQVDHDHVTGAYRSLLCKPCNFGLGVYEKNKEKFEQYLTEHGMK